MTPPERYPGERLDLPARLPAFVRRLLLWPATRGELGYLLRKQRGIEVWGIEQDPHNAQLARHLLDGVLDNAPHDDASPFDNPFDAIVLTAPQDDPAAFAAHVTIAARMLGPFGYFFAHLHAIGGNVFDPFSESVRANGFIPYREWPIENDTDTESASRVLMLFVRDSYSPIEHAGTLFDAGRPDASFEVLSGAPQGYLIDQEYRLHLRGEMLLSLMAMCRQNTHQLPLDYFDKAQEIFHLLVADKPDFTTPYQCQAEFWKLLGDSDMAARLLRSAHYAAPSEALARQLLTIPSRRAVHETDAPVWQPKTGIQPPRVLFILHPRPHYGLDILYDGLCRVLGEENVLDYPYKPSLHGAPPAEYVHYPCTFNRPGVPIPLAQLLADIERGRFDFIVFGDCEAGMPLEDARAIAQAAGDKTPIFVYDALDAAMNLRPRMLGFLGVERVAGYFKREMLACADYGPNSFPLPFAYPDGRVGPPPGTPRPKALFWAGHRMSGLRRLFLERIESRFGLKLDAVYPQDEYVRALHEHRLGLNCFGFGFDTVRYWELPAHGCMLLSERLPIRIPYNFRDGESAVFFDDLESLESKLAHYLDAPEECAAIAATAHAHLLHHHTGAARARHCLGWIAQSLSW